jgi:hypothetical protein
MGCVYELSTIINLINMLFKRTVFLIIVDTIRLFIYNNKTKSFSLLTLINVD